MAGRHTGGNNNDRWSGYRSKRRKRTISRVVMCAFGVLEPGPGHWKLLVAVIPCSPFHPDAIGRRWIDFWLKSSSHWYGIGPRSPTKPKQMCWWIIGNPAQLFHPQPERSASQARVTITPKTATGWLDHRPEKFGSLNFLLIEIYWIFLGHSLKKRFSDWLTIALDVKIERWKTLSKCERKNESFTDHKAIWL